jgi:catechol 2,3-dioxygenase-like lactoylglutathione lyase family enzyme
MRRARLTIATLLLIFLCAACGVANAQVDSVIRIGMTVEDVDRSVDFYTSVLDFHKVSDLEVAGESYEKLLGVFGLRARIVTLKLGDETIELTEYLAPRGRVVPRDSRSNDRWFQHVAIVTTDIDRAYQRLREHKVRHASTGPQTLPDWNPNAGGIKAFYFHDPDGHVLEIIQFPPGKGDPRWQSESNRGKLLLGIDHTAIVVADTGASLRFYQDALGMKIVGRSENWGSEQEHLNNVFGARLRITTLMAPSGGPGVELLEYLAPHDGRPYPSDAKPNDLFHWHTVLAVRDSRDVAKRVRNAGPADGSSAFLARDPDGHALLFTQE